MQILILHLSSSDVFQDHAKNETTAQEEQESMTDIVNEKIFWLMPWNASKVVELWEKMLRCKKICGY